MNENERIVSLSESSAVYLRISGISGAWISLPAKPRECVLTIRGASLIKRVSVVRVTSTPSRRPFIKPHLQADVL